MERAFAEEAQKQLIAEAQKELREGKKTPAQILDKLSKTGFFTFHGSGTPGIKELEPRTSTNFNPQTGTYEKDGLAVCATRNTEVVRFMGIISALGSRLDSVKSAFVGPYFFITPEMRVVIDQSDDLETTVYVLDSEAFQRIAGQWRSEKPVKPFLEVPITKKDFPQGQVTVIPSEKFAEEVEKFKQSQ